MRWITTMLAVTIAIFCTAWILAASIELIECL
jgi:hypothetical protein